MSILRGPEGERGKVGDHGQRGDTGDTGLTGEVGETGLTDDGSWPHGLEIVAVERDVELAQRHLDAFRLSDEGSQPSGESTSMPWNCSLACPARAQTSVPG